MNHARAIVVAILLASAARPAGAEAPGTKLLVGIVDFVTWHDLLAEEARAPTLRRLAGEGGLGMMCVRTAGRGGEYATIGAGSRASASPDWGRPGYPEGWAFQASEVVEGRAADRAFTSYTGWPTGDNAIIHLGIGQLIRENASAYYPLALGLLGGTLRRHGLHVACIGNADTEGSVHREAVALAMDETGMVELGQVGSALRERSLDLPYRVTTDPDRLLAAVKRVAAPADMIVVDLGETSRAAECSQLMPPGVARQQRYRAIERADRLLGQILALLPERDWAVLVLAPSMRALDPGEEYASLTPIIFRSPGGGRGLLVSPSTRRPGVVASTDVAATILAHFGIGSAAGMVGRAMSIEPTAGEALARLAADLKREDSSELVRRWAFRWLPGLGLVVLWASAGLLLLGDRAPGWTRSLVRGGLLVAVAAPPAMLLVGLRALSPLSMAGAMIGIAGAIALVGGGLTGWRSGHVLPAVLVAGLLVYDVVRGGAMLRWSPLSYSPALGARFYGIGNEYGAALLGGGLVAVACLSSRRERSSWGERFAASALLLSMAALVGHPRFGANFGMAVACAIGYGVLIVHLWWEYPSCRDAAGILALAAVVAGAAMAVDLIARGEEASHLGRLASMFRSEGWPALGQVVVRKWGMNWQLMRVSLWADMGLAALGVLGVCVLARPRRLQEALGRPWLGEAVVACVVGAAAAWVLNDSGTVAAAVVLLYGVGSLAYVGLGEEPVPT